ncbi:MAG: translation initiation factor IF-6 [Candidatus Heimdallarchaeaceae archaeon]
MEIIKSSILGNSSLGLYAFATDSYAIVPFGVKEEVKQTMQDILKVKPVELVISGSILVGVLACGNSNTILVPSNIYQKEIDIIQSNLDSNIEIVEIKSKYTALGNLILINDKGALISDKFEKEVKYQLKDNLDVEVEVGEILGSPLVGTMAMCTNKGALTHPLTSEEERDALRSLLGVKIDLCTVNRGVPYPRVGIVANSKGVIIGKETTGPESMRIFEILLT